MVNVVRTTLTSLESKSDSTMVKDIQRQLDQFSFDEQLTINPKGQDFSSQGHGTLFYIQPTDETLELDIDGAGDTDAASPLLKMLIGFTNTMTPGVKEPAIKTAFRDHKATDFV